MLKKFLTILVVVISLQIPFFMQLYENQLIGHVNELKWQVEEMQAIANESDKTLDEYIDKFLKEKDSDFSNQGKIMSKVKQRFEKLFFALNQLQKANPFIKPFIFFASLDYAIFKSTLASFKPGLPITRESLLYGLFAFLIWQFLSIVRKRFILRD